MADAIEDSRYARFALRCSNFAERWFPDSWVFAALAVIIVAVATLSMGAAPTEAAKAFGDGFWSLVPFTMQMAFVVIGGYVVASSPPAVKLIDRLARADAATLRCTGGERGSAMVGQLCYKTRRPD